MIPAFIGLDWGTTTLRAYLAVKDGSVMEMRQSPEGILAAAGRFEEVFAKSVETWPSDLPVIASGMIGSRQGWMEAPYCPCPAGLGEIAGKLVSLTTRTGRKIVFVPGLSCDDANGVPDVIRGEETQVLGALASMSGIYLLPGTHSKWLRVIDGRIGNFATFMTGEVYAVLKTHTILGRLMSGEGDDAEAFKTGVKRGAAAPELLLHTIFGTRTLGLFGKLEPSALPSYLSGLLIGNEIAAATHDLKPKESVTILASVALAARYAEACALCGVDATAGSENAAVVGLARIADAAGLLN
ncbi:MAG: 2-dehydro-3-deoxygalactonokinase [Rhizobiales bacterium]|nr:2-dehydro-3-deoxygalactonokinase [Hyphomicrobiales bacterium]